MTWAAHSWLFWALASAVFAALTAILAKLGTQEVDPDVATLVRTGVILALVLGIAAIRGKVGQAASVPGASLGWLVASGLATGASWVCYFRALKLGDASRVAPVDKLSVVFVAVFAVLVLGEKLSATGWAGVGLIAAGAALLAMS